MFREGKGNCCCSPDAEMSDMGPGVALYFMSLKMFGILFTLMSIVATPIMYMAAVSSRLEQDKLGSPLPLAMLSIANLGLSEQDRLAEKTELQLTQLGISIQETDAALIVMGLVFVNAIVLFLFVMWYPAFVERVTRQADESHVTTSDYAIYVRGLPEDATEEEVVDHFNNLYDLWGEDWVYRRCCTRKTKQRPKLQPDKELYRRRWANQHATAAHHAAGFHRNTADPVLSIDHIIDIRKDAKDADPTGWREEGLKQQRKGDIKERAVGATSSVEAAMGKGKVKTAGGLTLVSAIEGGIDEEAEAAGEETGGNGLVEGDLIHYMDPKDEELAMKLIDTFPEDDLGEKAARLQGTWIADVEMVYPNGKMLLRYLKVRKLLQKVEKEMSRASMYRALEMKRRLQRSLKKLDELEEKLRETNEKALTKWDDSTVVGAFVTFESEISRKRCLHDYRVYAPRTCCCCSCGRYPEPLLFRGKHSLEVSEAAEPDEVAWENLEVTDSARCIRSCMVSLAVLLILVVSLVVIIAAKVQGDNAESIMKTTGDPEQCMTGLPSLVYDGDLTGKEGFQILRNASRVCGDESAYSLSFSPPPPAADKTAARIAEVGDARCLNTTQCWKSKEDYSCTARVGRDNVTFSAGTVMLCYCLQELQNGISGGGDLIAFVDRFSTESAQCATVATNYIVTLGLSVAPAVLIVLVNAVLPQALTALAKVERHKAVSDEKASVAAKIFITQLINTGLIMLLVHTKVPDGSYWAILSPVKAFGLFNGNHQSFDMDWYGRVGATINFTIITNIVIPHAPAIINVLLRPFKFCFSSPTNDEEMAEMFSMPPFVTKAKYPIILCVVFVVCIYGGGMPLFFPVGAVFMWLTYWVDRCCLYRCAAKPDYEDASVARMFGSYMQLTIYLFLGFSIWMLSDETNLVNMPLSLSGLAARAGVDDGGTASWAEAQIEALKQQFESTPLLDGIIPNILTQTTFPLFIFLILIISGRLAYAIVGPPLVLFVRQVFWVLTCGLCCRRQVSLEDMDELNPGFSGFYYQSVQESNAALMSKLATDKQAEVVTDRYRGKPFKMTSRFFSKDDERADWRQMKGLRKRTWQVIQESQSCSYYIGAIPKYKDAFKAIKEGRKFQDAAKVAAAVAAEAEAEQAAELADWLGETDEGQGGSAVAPAGSGLIDDSAAQAAAAAEGGLIDDSSAQYYEDAAGGETAPLTSFASDGAPHDQGATAAALDAAFSDQHG